MAHIRPILAGLAKIDFKSPQPRNNSGHTHAVPTLSITDPCIGKERSVVDFYPEKSPLVSGASRLFCGQKSPFSLSPLHASLPSQFDRPTERERHE